MNFNFLKEELDKLVSEGITPGADCSVHIDHKEAFRYFAGAKDIEENRKLAGDELYIIFSMTKMLTCVSALQLYEKDVFQLDDPLAKYMDEFKEMHMYSDAEIVGDAGVTTGQILDVFTNNGTVSKTQNPITIRQLFSMTAGFDYCLKEEPILKSIEAGKTTTLDLVKSLSETVLGFEPGTRFRYSLCHDVLGGLVEIWSGMKLGDYMQENIFKPLGMKETFFGVPKDKERAERLASLYEKNEAGDFVKLPHRCGFNITDDYESGGAGLVSSTSDYALFLDALACGGVGKSGNRILKTETVEMMRSNQLKGQPLEDFQCLRKGYGYGLGVRTHIAPERSGSPSPVGEFGWDGAAGAFSLVDTENKLSLAYFQHMHSWEVSQQDRLKKALYQSLK